MKKLWSLVIVFLLRGALATFWAQQSWLEESDKILNEQFEISAAFKWNEIDYYTNSDGTTLQYLSFRDSKMSSDNALPLLSKWYKVSDKFDTCRVKIITQNEVYLTEQEKNIVENLKLSSEYSIVSNISRAKGDNILLFNLLPIRKVHGQYLKLTDAEILIEFEQQAQGNANRSGSWKTESILNSGDWYMLKTGEDGIYKIDYQDLIEYGFIPEELYSDNLRIYSNDAGMLPIDNKAKRPDDLEELPIYIVDGGDGRIEKGDYILFYGQDQVTWKMKGKYFQHLENPFTDSVAYFITANGGSGPKLRVFSSLVSGTPSYKASTYNFNAFHEVDLTNLIKSGRQWFGESLGITKSIDFGLYVPDVVKTKLANVRSRFALRSVSIGGCGINMTLPNQGGINDYTPMDAVPNGYALLYAQIGESSISFIPANSNFLTKIALDNAANSNALAWLDFIELNARRELKFIGPSFQFRDTTGIGLGNITEYHVISEEEIRVWDITDVHQIREMVLTGSVSSGYKFMCQSDSLHEFLAFNDQFLKPTKAGKVFNQNLHGLSDIEYVIVTHPLFYTQAKQLADLHSKKDELSSSVIRIQEIYNEFSGGVQDITAIKEFLRMLYHRAQNSGGTKPEYLLLFGDASYDYKNRISGNSNLVPSYQSYESLQPTSSVVSDDYFGLLDDNEGEGASDMVDIAIGRLPARSRPEADGMVNKIVRYVDSKDAMRDWRNIVTLVADDGDPAQGGLAFMRDADEMAGIIDTLNPVVNIRKIYADAYQQISGSGGQRYPDVVKAINETMRKGTLFMYYIGHGGELGWGHERFLEVSAINAWTNIDNLPIFLTATCEFSRFDDPRRTSAGEYVMINPSGGGVALLTTTRPVYSGPNKDLTTAFTLNAFSIVNPSNARIGDICAQTKITNASSNSLNSRCFTLLGDPAMRVAFPEEKIKITNIPDTISALDKVTISGYIVDRIGNKMKDFEGTIYPTLYDKSLAMQTLNNDGGGGFSYEERKGIIFKGKASVKSGEFVFQLVVPKDINRGFGGGKLSLYAENDEIDAAGSEFNFVIGGFSKNPVVDDQGPELDLFMNNNKFVFGGLTDENPNLYAEIKDESGINIVGTGIGHDATAVLDGNASNTMVLNDYYEADIDSYTSGKIRYPLNDLNEGQHSLSMQVWDVNNNPTKAFTEFIVASSQELAIDHVLNYPNPFTTNTDFYFDHNKPGQTLDVRIQVFTVSGKLIKVINGSYSSDGFRVGPINWNGRDEYGDLIGKGVYLYQVEVKTITGDKAAQYEKLVILK